MQYLTLPSPAPKASPVTHGLIPTQKPGPGWTRLFALYCLTTCTLGVISPDAEGFRLQRVGGPVNVTLSRQDIAQDGSTLGNGAEQTFALGNQNIDVTSFNQPLNIGVPGLVAGNVSATGAEDRFVRILLTPAERNRCLTHDDFEIDLSVDGSANTLTSATGGGGYVEVLDFQAVPLIDRPCRPSLSFGYRIRLGLDEAVAANDYRGTLEVEARLRQGGGVSRITSPIAVDLPTLLLLYHPQRVQLNLQTPAFAPLLSGSVASCGSDLCTDLGSIQLNTNSMIADAAIAPGATFTLGDQELLLRDIVAARALGCQGGIYGSATYQVTNTVGGIRAGNGQIDGIQGQSCGMDLRSGDVSVTLDLSDPANATSGAQADIQITVTGL